MQSFIIFLGAQSRSTRFVFSEELCNGYAIGTSVSKERCSRSELEVDIFFVVLSATTYVRYWLV